MSFASILLLIALICLISLPFAVPGLLELLLSLAIAAALNALLLWLDVLPNEGTIVLVSMAISTLVCAVLLWKPLRRLQKNGENIAENPAISDFVGTQLFLTAPLTKQHPSQIEFSGVHWQVRLSPDSAVDELPEGAAVKIVTATVGCLVVVPK